ncbi:MAG: hypothetical protein RJA63_3010 [Pseudomonadota bacterium]
MRRHSRPWLNNGRAEQRANGADACIAHVNAAGGVGGRRILVKDRDDGYGAEQAAREIQALIEVDQVLAVLGAFGTPTLPKVILAVDKAGVPLVGAASISDEARQPPRTWVFPVRVSAVQEASATVKHQLTIGARRFLVLSSKEAYGPSGAAAYASALRQNGLEVQEVAFAATDDPRQVAGRVLQAQPEVLLISVLPKPFAAVARAYRGAGGAARTFGLSVIRIEDLRTELGPLATGICLSQPVPAPMSRTSPLASEYRQLLAKYIPGAQPSYHGLEGFLEAKVMVEGLRRAGKRPTRQLLARALETLKGQDFGGVHVRYSEGDRTGSTFSELVMLGADGALVR